MQQTPAGPHGTATHLIVLGQVLCVYSAQQFKSWFESLGFVYFTGSAISLWNLANYNSSK